MDLIVLPCTLQKRSPKRMYTSNQESFRFGRSTPTKFRNPNFSTTSPQTRHHSQADRKCEIKPRECDIFENAYITKTIQFNALQNENYQQSFLITDKKVLKKKNGLIVFKPIPKETQLKSIFQSPEKYSITNQAKRRELKLKRLMDNEFMKSSLEKEKEFSDRNCRNILYDLGHDFYFQ
ncbi:unnamed protein product [Paramecium octaurelia]|uniref:Uncharacterized protein n=1 Tax=Paramecium octaurelia TaxID=43137 RepID=A0A8S1XYF8_PAROT|nr:unnamed protein product [Paramecium octaurelia]